MLPPSAKRRNLKSAAQPVIPQPPPAKGLSPLTLWIMAGFGLSGYVGYTKAATSKEWMPDVMLGVLFGAWFFTWPALLPIRQLPKVASQLHAHTSQPLQGFRSMLGLK